LSPERYGSVTKILVGLHQIGVVGLWDILKKADGWEIGDPEALIDRVMAEIAEHNYVPESQAENYRRAVWREYLRRKGEDISPYFSELEVTVRGEDGPVLERFTAILRSVLAEFELQPLITFAAAEPGVPAPALIIDDDVIVTGETDRPQFKAAVQRSISDW
jgi:hypothetical protein